MKLTLPEQLDSILSRLKSGIRRYVVIRGLAIFLSVVALAFWVTLAIDSAWFGLTRLELPRSTRIVLLSLSLLVGAGVLFRSLIWQLLIQLRRKALALVLEKRFPELNDRLITVVEAAETSPQEKSNPLPEASQSMLEKTLAEVCRITENLRIQEVFNVKPLRKSVLMAFFGLISIVATAAASPGVLSHWSKAYVELADDYWNRVNQLQLSVLSQPGDRIREFENRSLKHAAGTDLTILAQTVPGKVSPDQVVLTYRTTTGARGRALMTPAGEGKFRHTIGNLVDSLEFHVTGGDFTTIQPYRIETVDEPQIESLLAHCQYPEYTGWNQPDLGEETVRRLSSSELVVPMETHLNLEAKPTKPLTRVRIAGENFELELRRNADTGEVNASGRFLDERGMTTKTVRLETEDAPLISRDGLLVKIPLLITQKMPVSQTAQTETVPAETAKSETTQKTNQKPDSTKSDGLLAEITDTDRRKNSPVQETVNELTISQSANLRIFLEDTDGIMNLEPARLQIQGRADDPPVVQTRLAGVGKSITRKAIIPLSGTVSDDYGLSELFFEYRLESEETARQQPVTRIQSGEQLFVMEKTSENPTEKLDIMPLELKVNDILFVSLVAKDLDNLNGPHLTKGETYRMKIVSDEELLSLLHQDEMNLRRRFEHVIDELTRSRNDLASAATNQQENQTPETAIQVSEAIQRTLNMVQKDAVETDAIRVAFEGIREELLNNRVDTPQIRNRLEGKIIAPLARVIEREFSLAEENLRLLDFSLRTREATQLTAESCVQDVDQILLQLAQILQEMRKLESFQEVIELLKGIIDDERALKEKTEAERKKKLIDLLN